MDDTNKPAKKYSSEQIANFVKSSEKTRFKPGEARTREISAMQKGHPKPNTSINSKLHWMRARMKDGTLTNKDQIKLLDMMESGDKARFHIINWLIEMRTELESTGQELVWVDKVLQWAKLQYGEKQFITQVNIHTTADAIIERIENYHKKKIVEEEDKDEARPETNQ